LKHITRPSRILLRIFSHGLLAVLVMGVAASRPARGQQPAPAPRAASASPNSADKIIAQSGARETASEDENIYRHTPMVQSLSRALHLDVETTARLFEYFNFAIIFLAIVIPLARLLPKILGARSQALKRDLESARKMTTDAGARLSAIEAKLAGLDREISAIRSQVEEEIKNDEVRIKATIKEESQRIVAAAEQEIVLAATQAKRGLRHFAADLAVEQAARQLVLTQEADRALIAEFVVEAGRNGAAAKGRP
jgi:F-type H+-transporting ATPase subunit b